ncbi:MAG: transposase [Pseudomonadota bacterium]|nr:transposase [Pseudomonadota bacterium]
MQRNRYSPEFKEQALGKARQRGDHTLHEVASELNMSVGTLKGWLKSSSRSDAPSTPLASLPCDLLARNWSPAQRLLALHESHALAGSALHAWCREKGLFEHQLKQWNETFCRTTMADPRESRESKTALRELQVKHEKLQRELRRKEKALAEAAALLVLQKKFQALLADED